MSRWIDADRYITTQLYDEEHEEWNIERMTIASFLNRFTSEGCPDDVRLTPDESEAYRIVFEDLTSIDGLFTGRYDHKNGKEAFMYGISTVMEVIAAHVSDECYGAFQKRFFDNVVKSEERANAKQCAENTLDALERSSK